MSTMEMQMNEKNYTKKLSILAIHGGLWGDFIIIYWIYEYLHCSIHIWNKNNGWTVVKIKQENTSTPLILYMGTITLNLLKFIWKLQIFLFIFTMMTKNKKIKNHYMNINSQTIFFDKKAKIFSWNFKLDNNLLQIKKTNSDWMPQEIALIFIKNIHIYI